MSLRLYTPGPLAAGAQFALPQAAARHAQVRRVQPGDVLRVFNGDGQDWTAQVLRMSRSDIASFLGVAHATVSRSFSALAASACIKVSNRDVEILDAARLKSFSRATRGLSDESGHVAGAPGLALKVVARRVAAGATA